MLDQRVQTPLGQHRLALNGLEQRLLQFNVQRQLRVKLRRCRGVFAVVRLPQARQPGFGQVGTSLRQPKLTFDQCDHRQIVDRRHIPDVHQALGFSEFGKGFGEFATAAFEPGNHAMTDQYADIAAGAGFTQASLQSYPRRLGLQAQSQ
ncbi:hypothetical protein D3C72_1210090 [compost metagenome]